MFMWNVGRCRIGACSSCAKHAALIGFHLHPYLFRHPFAYQYLQHTGNDLVALWQLLGHESLDTTSRNCKQTPESHSAASTSCS